jgi:hypothetical protein
MVPQPDPNHIGAMLFHNPERIAHFRRIAVNTAMILNILMFLLPIVPWFLAEGTRGKFCYKSILS